MKGIVEKRIRYVKIIDGNHNELIYNNIYLFYNIINPLKYVLVFLKIM